MNQVHYEITKMENQTMKTSLKNALDKIEGVQEVNIDVGRSTVEIGFNEPADENQIKSCIERSGSSVS